MSLVTIPNMRRAASPFSSLKLNFTLNALDPRINFSRTTNATVTNSAGQITYAPHNLLTYSEQFDNAYWLKYNASISANSTTAPSGTTTADTFSITNTVGAIYINRGTLAFTGQMSLSIRAKQGTNRYFALLVGDTALDEGYVVFDLQAGVVGQTSNGTGTTNVSGSIVADKNGFFTCTMNFTRTTIGILKIELAPALTGNTLDTAGEITGNTIGNNVYIWGAQLEIGSTATTYNSTTVKNLLGYSELFDNAAWTKSNSFVQTNLLTYSEAFDNASWTKAYSTVTADTTLAPNGYQTADTLFETAITQSHSVYKAVTVTNAIVYTFSAYLKPAGRNWARLTLQGTTEIGAYFDLANGVLGTVDAGVTATITLAANGFYRCSVSRVTDNVSTYTSIYATTGNNTTVYAGDITKGIYIWGAQLVQGSVAGDYRRTDAAALPVYYPNHNGVVCAELVVENTSAAYHHVTATSVGGGTTNTMSMYAKQYSSGSKRWLYMYPQPATGSAFAIFDLTSGTVTATGNGGTATYISSSITPVGNGWYRCSITFTGVAGNVICQYGLSNSSTTAATYTGDGTSGLYVFGTQLSDSASLDPYVLNAAAAPTAAAYYGARFDYDPVTLAPKGLLIEEQRSNMLLNSAIAGTDLATQNVTVTAVAHTLSFYGTGSITLSGTASATLNGTGAYPTRSTLTFTPTAGTLTLTVSGTVQYAQLEIGSFATSYIPTGASQTTRAADVATIQGSNFYSWINQNAGSLYAQFITPASGNRNIIALDDNTANNNIRLRTEGTDPYLKQAWVGTEQVALDLGTVASNTIYKIAASYQINDYAGVIANGTVGTDTVANTPIITMARLGTDQAGAYLNSTIKTFTYYPQKLSTDILKGLTA